MADHIGTAEFAMPNPDTSEGTGWRVFSPGGSGPGLVAGLPGAGDKPICSNLFQFRSISGRFEDSDCVP